MGAAVFTSGPYIEMVISPLTPMTPSIEDGVVTWRVPLGEGAVPHVALDDCGFYVRWLFDHPELANGMDLEVAIEHMNYADMAAAFEKVTGHQARYIDTDLNTYWNSPDLKGLADHPAGYNADPNDKSTMSFRDNFTGFWNMWNTESSPGITPCSTKFTPTGSEVPSSGSAGKTSSEGNSAREASGKGSSRRTGA